MSDPKSPEPVAALTPIAVIANPERYTNIQVHNLRADSGFFLPHDAILLAMTKGTIVVETAGHYNNYQAKTAEGLILVTAKNTNEEFTALCDKVGLLQGAQSDARMKQEAAVKGWDGAVKQVTELSAQVADLTDLLSRTKAQLIEKEGARRLLEAHLAKVRGYFGEKAFQEAISASKA